MKVIGSDNEAEYTSVRYKIFCAFASIEHQLTVTYTSQQNKVMWKEEQNNARDGQVFDVWKIFSNMFWAEVVNTSL